MKTIEGKTAPTYYMGNVKTTDELLILTVIAGDLNKFNTTEITEQLRGKTFEDALTIFENTVGEHVYISHNLTKPNPDLDEGRQSVIYDGAKMCETFMNRLFD